MASLQTAKLAYDRIQALLGDDYNESLSAIRYEPEDSSHMNTSWVDGESSALVVSEQQPFVHCSNELHFHALLEEFLASYGLQAVNNLSIASEFALCFAEKCNQSHEDFHRARSRVGSQRFAAESRAERDLWSLLQMLSSAHVLGEVHTEDCEMALERATRDLSPIITAPEYINVAMESDFRIKKGFIIKDWLERCSKDLVRVITPPKMPPAADTLFALLEETKNVQFNARQQHPFTSIHPDAQISSGSGLYSWLGDDSLDQERLLTCIWQLLRSGQMADAQKFAFDHQAHWYAAALRGMDPHFYEITSEQNEAKMQEENEDFRTSEEQLSTTSVQRKGNLKQGLWIRTAWRYAEHLFKAVSRSPVSSVTELEMNIFALLSHHLEILRESSSNSLLSSWHDRLWVYIGAIHNRDIMKCVLNYHEIKARHSTLYPALDNQSTLMILDELLRQWERQLQGLSMSNLEEMFVKVKFVAPSPSRNVESILYQLQAAVLSGPRSLSMYLEDNLMDLISSEHQQQYQGQGEIMRIITHLLIWCHSLPDDNGHEMKDIVSEETYFKVLEMYIDHLIKNRHFVLVAGYTRLLSRHRRINAYAKLLLTLHRLHCNNNSNNGNWEDGAEARQAMHLAQQFFPDDIVEITRRVVNHSSSAIDINDGIEEEKKNEVVTQHQKKTSVVQSLDQSILTPFLISSTKSNKKTSFKSPLSLQQQQQQQQGLSDSDRMALESIGWAVMDDGAAALRSVHRVLIGRILSLGQENIREKMEVLPLMMHHAHLLEDVFLDRLEHARELHLLAHPPLQQTQVQAPNELNVKQWNADKNLFQMWSMLVGLQDPWSSWKLLVQEYERDRVRTVNADANPGIFMRYGQGLYRLAVDGVLPFVQELFVGVTTPDTNGVPAYCHAAMSAAREMVLFRLNNALFAFESDQDVLSSAAVSSTAALVSDVDNGSRFEEITQLLRQIPSLLAQTEAKYPGQFVPHSLPSESIQRSCEKLQHGVLKRMLSTPQIVMLHENLSLLEQALQDYHETWQLLRAISTYLLQVYLLTATQTATVLQQVGLVDQEQELWTLAMKLGDLLASEDPKLLLYRTIDREVLEQLVQGLAEAARQLLPNGTISGEAVATDEGEEFEDEKQAAQDPQDDRNNNEMHG